MSKQTDREKLIELCDTNNGWVDEVPAEKFADYLLSHGVTFEKQGEWIDNGERDIRGVPKPFAISCSICGSSAGTSWMNYCPNCGARMKGE